jgi:hypothetical protein
MHFYLYNMSFLLVERYQEATSAADVSEAVLNVILSADHKQMPTNHYCHVASAMNIAVSGSRNL